MNVCLYPYRSAKTFVMRRKHIYFVSILVAVHLYHAISFRPHDHTKWQKLQEL